MKSNKARSRNAIGRASAPLYVFLVVILLLFTVLVVVVLIWEIELLSADSALSRLHQRDQQNKRRRRPTGGLDVGGRATRLRCPSELYSNRKYRYLHQLCRTSPKVAIVAEYGLRQAVTQCERQMRYEKWNCAVVARNGDYTNKTLLDDPPLIHYGYRETSFLLAMSSAGVSWSVATGCAQGHLDECACNMHQHSTQQNWEWGGCSYGVKYGLVTSRKLLNRNRALQHKRNIVKRMIKHNYKAGRMAIKRTLRKNCKCHGVSGSCEMKTCWQATSNLNQIGTHLKHKYHRAKFLLRQSDSVSNDSRPPTIGAKSADLVFTERSPDYCRPVAHLRLNGTRGRVCSVRNETHYEGNCDGLCCYRGYTVRRETYRQKCNCRFVWCCRVECDSCEKIRWVATCN